jgi:hypothetical protein
VLVTELFLYALEIVSSRVVAVVLSKNEPAA